MTNRGAGEIEGSRSCLKEREEVILERESEMMVIKFPKMLKPKGKQFTVMEESR